MSDLFDRIKKQTNSPAQEYDSTMDQSKEIPSLFDKISRSQTKANFGATKIPGFEVEDYKSYLGDIFDPLSDIDERRAQSQSWGQLAGNFLGQLGAEFLIGMPEVAGYMVDFEDIVDHEKESQEGFDNWFSKYFREAKEHVHEEWFPVYQTRQAQEGSFWERLGDPTWRAAQGRTIGTTLALMGPAIGAAALMSTGVGAAGGSAALANLMGAITAGLLSRKAESAMESQGLFEEEYNKYIQEGLSNKKARELAGEAAATAHKANAMLLPFDIAQYALMMKPFSGLKKTIDAAKKSRLGSIMEHAVVQPGSEAIEEGWQFVAQEEAIAGVRDNVSPFGEGFGGRLGEYISDPEFQTSTFMGAVTGGIFSAVGPVSRKVANKTDEMLTQKAFAANLKDEQSFNKIDNKIKGNLLVKAVNTNKLDDLGQMVTAYNEKVQNDPESSDEVKASTKRKTDKFIEDIEYIKSKDEQIKKDNPDYIENNNVRKAFALLNYENKLNNEQLENNRGLVAELATDIFKDEKDVAVKASIELDNLKHLKGQIKKSDVSEDIKNRRLTEIDKSIQNKQEELNGYLESLSESFNLNDYYVDNSAAYGFAHNALLQTSYNKDILAEQLSQFTKKSTEEIKKEDAEIENKKVEKLKKQQRESVKENVRTAKKPQELNFILKETRGKDIHKDAVSELKKEAGKQPSPNYVDTNKNPVNSVKRTTKKKVGTTEDIERRRQEEIKENREKLKTSLVVKEDGSKREDFSKDAKLTSLENNKVVWNNKASEKQRKVARVIKKDDGYHLDQGLGEVFLGQSELEARKTLAKNGYVDAISEGVREYKTDDSINAKYDAELAELKKGETKLEEINRPLLPKYNQQSPHVEANDVRELSNALNKALSKEAKDDANLGIKLQSLSNVSDARGANYIIESLYDTQFADKVADQVLSFLTTKQSKIKEQTLPSEYDGPITDDIDIDQVLEQEEAETDNAFMGLVMEQYIDITGKVKPNKEVSQMEDPDYSHEYITNPDNAVENSNPTIQFEVYKGDYNSKALKSDDKVDSVQIMGVMYTKDGKRHAVTMLGARKLSNMSDTEYKKLQDIRKYIVDNAVEFFKNNPNEKIFKSDLVTTAEKGRGKIIRTKEFIPANDVEAKPVIDGKKRFLLGVVRWTREDGTYVDSPNTPYNKTSTQGKPGSAVMWVTVANGNVIPVRLMTKNFARIKREHSDRYKKEFEDIKRLLSETNSDQLTKNLQEVDRKYFNTLTRIKRDNKGNITSVSFTKKRLADSLERISQAKTDDARNEAYNDALNNFSLNSQELDRIIAGDQSVYAENASTKNLVYFLEVGETNPDNPNSVNSKEFETFLADMEHQVDENQINAGNYNNEISELLRVNVPGKVRITPKKGKYKGKEGLVTSVSEDNKLQVKFGEDTVNFSPKDLDNFDDIKSRFLNKNRVTHSPIYHISKDISRTAKTNEDSKDLPTGFTPTDEQKALIGTTVKPLRGKYKGQTGTIEGYTDTGKVRVRFEDGRLNQYSGTTLDFIEENTSISTEETQEVKDVDNNDPVTEREGTEIKDEPLPEDSEIIPDEEQTDMLDDLLGDDTKLRKADSTAYKGWNKQEEEWLRENLPIDNEQVRFDVAETILNVGGLYSWGKFEENLIEVWRGAKAGTIYHEAFHAVFNMALNDTQKRQLLIEASRKYNIRIRDIEALEERLAEDFTEYIQSMEYSGKTLPQRIAAFFRRLYNLFKHNFLRSNKIEEIYYHINAGDFKNAEFKTAKNVTRRSRFGNMNYVQEQLRIDTLSNQMSEVVDDLALEKENRELSRQQIITKYGLDSIVVSAYKRLIDNFKKKASTYSDIQRSQYKTMLLGFINLEKDANGKTVIPDAPTKNLLGRKAITIFGENEKLIINVEKGNTVYGIDPLTNEEITEMSEEIDNREHWMMTAQLEAKRDKVRAEVKSELSRIPKRNYKGEIVKDDLGFNTYLSYNESFATLLRELSDTTSSEEMIELLDEYVNEAPEFAPVLDKVTGDESFKTKFWLSLQNSHADVRLLRQEYEEADVKKRVPIEKRRLKYQWMSANRQAITQHIMTRWKDGINSPISSFVQREKDNLLKGDEVEPRDNKAFKQQSDKWIAGLELGYMSSSDYQKIKTDIVKDDKRSLAKFANKLAKTGVNVSTDWLETQFTKKSKDYFNNLEQFHKLSEGVGLDVTLEELQTLEQNTYPNARGYQTNSYVDFVSLMKTPLRTILQGKDPSTVEYKSTKNAARKISRIRHDYMESSFRNGENKTQYSHIMISYVSKFINELKKKENFSLNEIADTGLIAGLMQTPGYNNLSWLKDLARTDVRENFKYALFDSLRLKGNKDGITYTKLDAEKLNIVRLNAYYNNANSKFAYFMVPVLSDTPTNMYIQARRLNTEDAINATTDSLLAEWDLVQNIDKVSGVKNLGKRGRSLVMFEKLDNPEVRKLLTDYNKAIDFQNTTKAEAIREQINAKVEGYLNDKYNETLKELIEQELIVKNKETGKLESRYIDHNIIDVQREGVSDFKLDKYPSLEEFVREYTYNNVVSKVNMTMLFLGSPAAYENTEDIYKRLKQIWAPGTRLDTTAKFHLTEEQMKAEGTNNPVVEVGKNYRAGFFKDVKIRTKSGEEILKIQLEAGKGDEAYAIAGRIGYFNYTDKAGKKWSVPVDSKGKFKTLPGSKELIKFPSDLSNTTDGQSFISPRRKRKIDIGTAKWNSEKQDDFIEIIEGRPSEVVHNPEKPFVFGFRTINGLKVPIQIKNSETILNPALSFIKEVDGKNQIVLPTKEDREANYSDYKTPTLAKILDYMERYSYDDINYVDVVHFNSTVKVGEYGVGTLDNMDAAEVQTLSNEDYMLMQEVGDHFTDDRGNFGTQIRKLVIADISDGTVFKSDEFGELDKDKLIKLYQDIIEEDVTSSFSKIDSTFPKKLDVEGKQVPVAEYNEKLKKFSDKLIQEANERNLGSEAIDALGVYLDKSDGRLKFNVPLFDPIHASRTQALAGSLYKNNVVKQKINGGNFVMASSVGFSDALNINYKDGAIESFDVMLPWWSKQSFEGLIDPDTGIVDINKIEDKSILNLIGYRIPTEDKYSMIPMRVKGFLPRSSGGVIILPDEITSLSGADFDIDKLYVMIPNFRIDRKWDFDKLANELRDNGYSVTAGFLGDLFKRVNNNEALSERDLEIYDTINLLPDIVVERVSQEPKIKKIKYDYSKTPQEQSKKARDNAKIDLIWSILTNKDTAEKLTDPGNFDHVSNLADLIKKKTGYSANLDLLSPTTESKMFEAAMAANGLIGVFANQNINHSIFQHGDINLKKSIVFGKDNDGNPVYYSGLSDVNGIEHDVINRADLPKELGDVVPNDPKRISRKLAMMLSAIVDDLKHLNSGPLNINFFTADVLSTAMRLGMSMTSSIALINQPAVMKLAKLYKKYGDTFDVYDRAYNETIKSYNDGASNVKPEDLDINILWDNIGKKTGDVQFQMEQVQALELFNNLREISLDVGKGIRAFRSDNLTRKVSLESNEVFERNVKKFLDSDRFTGVQELWDNYHMMKAFYETGVKGSTETLNQFYVYNSPAFMSIKDRISDNLVGAKELSEDNLRNINYTIMGAISDNFETFNGNLKTKGKTTREYLLKDFPAEFEKFVKDNPKLKREHLILQRLEKKNKDKYVPIDRIVHINTGNLTESDKAKISDSWLGLIWYKNPDNKELEAQVRDIGLNLVKYTYHAYSFGMTAQSFSQYIPMKWRARLRDSNNTLYNDFLENTFDMSQESGKFENLYRQFKQHYASNRFFVQRLEPTEEQLKSMKKFNRITIVDNVPTFVRLSSTENSNMMVSKSPDNKNRGVFPDMIYMEHEGNPVLFEAVNHDPTTNVVFQEYKPISILGVKNYATEYDVSSDNKKSIFEFNNPRKESIVETPITETTQETTGTILQKPEGIEQIMWDRMTPEQQQRYIDCL